MANIDLGGGSSVTTGGTTNITTDRFEAFLNAAFNYKNTSDYVGDKRFF